MRDHRRRTRELLYTWTDWTPDAAAEARKALQRALVAHTHSAQCVDDIVLAASELVANAIEHGSGPYELWLQRNSTELICEVHDRDPHVPRQPDIPDGLLFEPDPQARGGGLDALCALLSERGRGLGIVDLLTTGRWGFFLIGESRKVAWAAFPVEQEAGR